MHRFSRNHWARTVIVLLVFAIAYSAPHLATPAAAEAPVPGAISFDGAGPLLVSGDGPTAAEFLIGSFSGGSPGVRWLPTAIPVPFCTIDANRPASVTAAQFHEAVRVAAEMWNNIDAAIGIRYAGGCATAQVSMGNRVNEIGWDDDRNAVSGSAAAVMQGAWLTGSGTLDFLETDIVIDNNFNVPEVCLRTIVAHEMGHAIGFGHSDVSSDLMAVSLTPNDLATCRPSASGSEVAWLIALYGSNRKPLLTKPADRSVQPGAVVSVTAEASDPEGDPIVFEWKQVVGPTVMLSSNGATTSFTAPASGAITIEVSALDRYLHRAITTVTVTVVTPIMAPILGPILSPIVAGGFLGSIAPSGVSLVQWSGGTLPLALATPDINLRSLWVLQGGVATGYIAGAPDFVNQPFLALFPGGSLPAGTLLAVVAGN